MHLFCAAVRTHRWFAHDQKIKKKQKTKKTFTPSERFSLTCYETNTENITTSNQRQGSYHKEPMRIQTEKQGNCQKRGKTWTDWAQKKAKKPVFSSATDDIQQTPVTPNTFSSPKVMWTRNNFRKTSFPETSLLWRGRKSILWILYECYTWCLKRDELRALCQDLDATGTPTAAHAVWVLACPGHLWWSLQALPFDWEGNGKWLVGGTLWVGNVSRPGFLPE